MALRAVAIGKISAFLLSDYKLVNHKAKKSQSFNLFFFDWSIFILHSRGSDGGAFILAESAPA